MNQKMLNILFQTFWVLKCPSHIFNTFIGVWKEWFWSQTICQTMMTPELFLIIVRRHWRCWFISIFPWEGFPFVSSPKHGHWHSKEQRGAAPSKALPRILRNGTHHLIVGQNVVNKFQLSFPRYHPHHLCGETPVFQTFQAVLFLYRLDLLVGRHKSWQVGWDLRSEQDISCLSRQPSMQQFTPPSNVDADRSFSTCHQHSQPAVFPHVRWLFCVKDSKL